MLAVLILAEGLTAFCALGFEVAMARLVAPHAGMSTDTWTAISNRTQPTTKPACGRRHERKMVDTGYRFLARIYRPSS